MTIMRPESGPTIKYGISATYSKPLSILLSV
jgi:hypothetical protein